MEQEDDREGLLNSVANTTQITRDLFYDGLGDSSRRAVIESNRRKMLIERNAIPQSTSTPLNNTFSSFSCRKIFSGCCFLQNPSPPSSDKSSVRQMFYKDIAFGNRFGISDSKMRRQKLLNQKTDEFALPSMKRESVAWDNQLKASIELSPLLTMDR